LRRGSTVASQRIPDGLAIAHLRQSPPPTIDTWRTFVETAEYTPKAGHVPYADGDTAQDIAAKGDDDKSQGHACADSRSRQKVVRISPKIFCSSAAE
jgi:hypothetical protein